MKALSIPKQITVRLFVSLSRGIDGQPKIRIRDFSVKDNRIEDVPLFDYETTIDIPGTISSKDRIQSLRQLQAKIMEESRYQFDTIETEIQSLESDHAPVDPDEIPF